MEDQSTQAIAIGVVIVIVIIFFGGWFILLNQGNDVQQVKPLEVDLSASSTMPVQTETPTASDESVNPVITE